MASLCVCLGLVTLAHAYVNVALNKPAFQRYPYPGKDAFYDASNAVDGLKTNLRFDGGECVISADGHRTATWWVNLTSIHSIHHIIIYYRTGNVPWWPSNGFRTRFLGFSVYVSNTTNRLQGKECFKDRNFTLDTIPPVFNTTCPVRGQYVIYYNERLLNVTYPLYYSQYAHNELCEVEVYACSDGYFGQDCARKCNATCAGCNKVNGLCDSGCHPGWKGNYCQQHCDSNMFGAGCSMPCGHCLESKQCHHINGTCMNGCDSGYQGLNCTQECSAGYFGENCASTCGQCLNEKLCNHVTGDCEEGCVPGYKEPTCKTVCDSNLYGENCTMLCGHCHKSEQCHHINGTCMNGCDRGYQGSICMEACNQRKYGEHCSMLCGHCLKSEQCHHINGTCINGCDSGYQGVKCTKECDKHFGPNCIEKCNTTCKSCDISTGVCNNDCHPGWRGLFCHEVCEFGSYGFGCNQECSTFCKRSRDCHHVSGNCKDGCKSGWQGLDCLEVSKLTVTEKKLTSEFNGILSAFCILLFLNGVVITYFAVKRFRNSKVKQPAIYQSNITQKGCESEISNVYINDNNRSEYQELGEISKTETYSTLQDVNSLQQGNKISATLT